MIIIYISGDNGASAEGMLNGTPNEFTTFNGLPVPVKDQFLWYEFWGSERTFPHFAAPRLPASRDGGWNKLRETIFANQKRLGIMSENAQLTPWPKELPAGLGNGGTGVLYVDGREVARKSMEHGTNSGRADQFSDTNDEA